MIGTQKKHLKKYKIYVSIQADKEISKDIKRNVLCQYFDYSRDKILDDVYIQYIEYVKQTTKKKLKSKDEIKTPT